MAFPDAADVHVVAPGGRATDPLISHERVTLHAAGGGSLFGWPGALPRLRAEPWRIVGAASFLVGATARIRALRRRGRIDRVIAHWMVPSAFPLAFEVDAPLEVVAHGADVRLLLAAPGRVREGVLGAIARRATRMTFASRSLLDALSRAVSPEVGALVDRVAHVEPSPITLPDVGARATELRGAIPARVRLVVCAGRVVRDKRVDLAIDAVARVAASVDCRIVIVGDGPERATIEARTSPAMRERVRWTGTLPRDEALAWIAAADVVVHPSAVEAAPTVVREARALGTPVVACDAGDVAAWARSDAGIVLAEPTDEDIARGIVLALAFAKDSISFRRA